ncbi:hypothetical protein [Aquella oligotrophica]|uniref:Uncharacterized protein n=1 Tax=Aquella oligotrophica TaxID=2067065 RepID=A0A2I7N6B8_9NEIS|nr:hypothetical protein [Aquella oligotrophica]AUR51982.1 hypothetical protein CUN60_06610 [Aquella oligotrophica]
MKKTVSLLLASIYLAGCNSGTTPQEHTNSGFTNPTTPLQKALNKSLFGNETNISLNLYNSIYLTPTNSYNYTLEDLNGTIVNSGQFTCKDTANCLISIPVTSNQTYSLSILDKENSFIGAVSFTTVPGNTYMELNIDDISTGNYLSQIMMNKLQNPFTIANVEANLFRAVINYKPNLTVNEIVYAYFIYLTKTKGLTTLAAINQIATEYQNCEAGECKLENDFIKDDSSINKVLKTISETITNYAQNKNDAQLYAAYQWFKQSPIPTVVTNGINIANQFFPGASDAKLQTRSGAIFQALDSIITPSLSGSKEAYDKAQLFDKNLGTFYTKSPDYLQMINEVTGNILSYQVLNDFNKAYSRIYQDYNLANGHLVILNDETKRYEYLPISDYINHYKKRGINYDSDLFSWIIKNRDSDIGIWDRSSVIERADSIDRITAKNNIDTVALSYKKIFFKDGNPSPVDGVDTISPRKLYNQALLMDLQKSINTLQYSMYLDNLALLVRDGIVREDPIAAANFNRMEIIAQIKGSIDLTKGDYAIHQMQLKNYYMNLLNNIQQAYKQQILPEKQYVPENVLQTLELDGNCNINYSDGLNVLKAKCPLYYGENNLSKVKYIDTTLDRSKLKCLTTNADGSGGLMAIADVRNMSGRLQCLTNNYVNFDLVTNIGIPAKGYEQSKGNSLFTGKPNYIIRYSKAEGARDFLTDYFLKNKVFFYLNDFDLYYQKGRINYMYIPLPYLVNRNGQDSYHIESGNSMINRPDISVPPSTKDDMLTVKDKYNNTVFSYFKKNSPAEMKWISQVTWGGSTYMHFNTGIFSLYSNQIATKYNNGFYLTTTNGDSTIKVKIDYETIYTEYPEKTGDVYTIFMPMMELVN